MKYIKTLNRVLVLILFSSSVMAETAYIQWQRDTAKAPKDGLGNSFSYDELAVAVPVAQWQQGDERLNTQVKLNALNLIGRAVMP